MKRRYVIIAFVTLAPGAHAQGSTFAGRVLTDSGAPLAGAEVVIAKLQKSELTNEKGEFSFSVLPAGFHAVGTRMSGFAPKGDTIEVADAGDIRREYRLTRIETVLPEVPVTTTLLDRKLSDFHERRRVGIGRFLDSAEFANARGTRTADRLLKLPGLTILSRRFSEGFVASTRQRSRGAAGMCRSLVWLDNVNLGTSFNVNELDPSIIAGVEWYAGQASIPPRFAVPARPGESYCGVLVIWLR